MPTYDVLVEVTFSTRVEIGAGSWAAAIKAIDEGDFDEELLDLVQHGHADMDTVIADRMLSKEIA